MLNMGVSDGDAGFVSGGYRMTAYGYAIGFLSGLVNVESGKDPVTDCDVRAADPYDPRRHAHGVLSENIAAADAEASCRNEVAHSDYPRATFQLARAVFAQSGRDREAEQLAREAAGRGVASAFTLVADIIAGANATGADQARRGASQRVIIESFPILYPFLMGHASTDRERAGLAWYAQKAAALGVPEAHMALADTADREVDKLLHARIAALLFDEAGNQAEAKAARGLAKNVSVSAAESGRIDAEVADWRPEALVALPEQTSDSS